MPQPQPGPSPDFDSEPNEKKSGGRLLGIALGVLLTLAIFTVLMIVTMGQVLPALLIGGAVLCFAAFHYLVWGWWLSGYLRDIEKHKDRENRE